MSNCSDFFSLNLLSVSMPGLSLAWHLVTCLLSGRLPTLVLLVNVAIPGQHRTKFAIVLLHVMWKYAVDKLPARGWLVTLS